MYTYMYAISWMCNDDHHSRVCYARACLCYTSVSFYLSVCLSSTFTRHRTRFLSGAAHDRRKDEPSVHVHHYTHTLHMYISLSHYIRRRTHRVSSSSSLLPRILADERRGRIARVRTKGAPTTSPARLKTASSARVCPSRGRGSASVRACVCVYYTYIPAFPLMRPVSSCNLVFEGRRERGKKLIQATGASAGPCLLRRRDQQRERKRTNSLPPHPSPIRPLPENSSPRRAKRGEPNVK